MGLLFVQSLPGPKVFKCKFCRVGSASPDAIVSKEFRGRHGRANLFESVVNVSLGPNEDRSLTGSHTVNDIYFSCCQQLLGWKYDGAIPPARPVLRGEPPNISLVSKGMSSFGDPNPTGPSASDMACTFIEWVDRVSPAWPDNRAVEVENKGQYFSKMTQAREVERQMRLEQERRVRVDQIRLQGKEDELQRRKEKLSLREAAIKRQEEELQAREAALKTKSDRKKDAAEPSSGRDRKGKQPRYTQ